MGYVWGNGAFFSTIGVLLTQEFLGIKHSEGKRKDGDGMALTVCIPITLSEYDTMLGRKIPQKQAMDWFSCPLNPFK